MEYELKDIDESYTLLITKDIEFKKKVIETLSVFEEGYKFNPLFRAGVWDGKKYFYSIEQGNIKFLKGLVEYIIKDLKSSGYKYTYTTTTKEYELDKSEFEQFITTLNLPFTPYDYQVNAAYDMLVKKRLTIRSATGCLDPNSLINTKLSREDYEFLQRNF